MRKYQNVRLLKQRQKEMECLGTTNGILSQLKNNK
jgi:hypothetical protein